MSHKHLKECLPIIKKTISMISSVKVWYQFHFVFVFWLTRHTRTCWLQLFLKDGTMIGVISAQCCRKENTNQSWEGYRKTVVAHKNRCADRWCQNFSLPAPLKTVCVLIPVWKHHLRHLVHLALVQWTLGLSQLEGETILKFSFRFYSLSWTVGPLICLSVHSVGSCSHTWSCVSCLQLCSPAQRLSKDNNQTRTSQRLLYLSSPPSNPSNIHTAVAAVSKYCSISTPTHC